MTQRMKHSVIVYNKRRKSKEDQDCNFEPKNDFTRLVELNNSYFFFHNYGKSFVFMYLCTNNILKLV